MKQKSFPIWVVLGTLFLVFSFFTSVITLFADWWWFSELGYTEVFLTTLTTKSVLGAIAALITFIFLLINLHLALTSKSPWLIKLPDTGSGRPTLINTQTVKQVGTLICLIVGIVLGFMASSAWQDVLKLLSLTPFGAVDPVFGKEISFYIFSLPAIVYGLNLLKIILLIALVGCVLIYVLHGSLRLPNLLNGLVEPYLRSLGMSLSGGIGQSRSGARLHMAILLAVFCAALAASTYTSLFTLLTGQSGQVYGAIFTDVYVMIPILWASIGSIILVALALLYWGKSGKHRFLFATVILYFIVGLASSIVPSLVQKLVVAPNELAKETPFIEHNIAATRHAFGLDKVEELAISGDKPLTAGDIANNNLTIKNVRLWDRAPLLSTFSQLQEIRTYYEFASVDNDRYNIDGEIRQIMLSPRELSSESLPNRNWINERLTFTHGYGLAAGPVNQVTAEGLPVLFVKDLPPISTVKELAVTRPEIYYGELSNEYVIVNTKSKEFDYPKGEENVFSVYAGKGGVEINSPIRRLLYAIHFRSLKLLLSNDVTEQSRILYHRNVKERIGKIAPFLVFDRDPYAVIADEKIYWIADAYTTSNLYPYSQPLLLNGGKVNYIRNSVKVVVDAYDGSTTFYLADKQDPIISTYAKIFPTTFRPLEEMPANLSSHLRYPEDIFTLQTAIYSTYHMDDPQIFYNKEDQWEVPAIAIEGEKNSASQIPAMTPRHMIMKLPAEKKEEYVLMLPFTPRSKDNLSAWMVARNDGVNYGKLLVYRFPKQKLIFGPKQVIGRINQDAEISRQIALWDQRGSQVIQGPLLIIPIEESLIYVRSLYLKAEAGKIPELKRVLVSYGNKVAMEESLEAGLAQIFGSSIDTGAGNKAVSRPGITAALGQLSEAPSTDLSTVITQANQVYEAALRAQRNGDWARYGQEIKKLGELLNKLQR